MTGSRAA